MLDPDFEYEYGYAHANVFQLKAEELNAKAEVPMSGHISVIGNIWMPNAQAAYSYGLSEHDIDNMRGEDGKIARCDIERWLSSHAGDFQSIDDFSASIGTANYGWKNEESELLYSDLVYGEIE